MFANLDDIVCYTDNPYNKAYIDIYTYKCQYLKQIANGEIDSTRYIELPQFDEISIIKSYIEESGIKELKKIVKSNEDERLVIKKFHYVANNIPFK